MMELIFIVVFLPVLVMAGGLFAFMRGRRQIAVEMSGRTKVNLPMAETLSKLADVRNFPLWSPWLRIDPEAKVELAPDQNSVKWEGLWSGKGTLEGLKLVGAEIRGRLVTNQPALFDGESGFFVETDGTVIWKLKGETTVWNKRLLQGQLELDLNRGMRMFREWAERGIIPSNFTTGEVRDRPGMSYVGYEQQCAVESIAKHVKQALAVLQASEKRGRFEAVGAPFTIYRRWDLANDRCYFLGALPVAEGVSPVLDLDFFVGIIPPHKALEIVHTGSYEMLGNAWSAGHAMVRAGGLRLRGEISPYEVYLDDPETTETDKLRTLLCFPIL